MYLQTSDKLGGSMGAVYFFIKVHFNPGEFAGDLFSALLIAIITTIVSWAFRRFILDKIKFKNGKK